MLGAQGLLAKGTSLVDLLKGYRASALSERPIMGETMDSASVQLFPETLTSQYIRDKDSIGH